MTVKKNNQYEATIFDHKVETDTNQTEKWEE